MTSFEELRRGNTARCQRWHPGFPDDKAWSIADWACALAGEADEALNVVKKIRRIALDTLSPTGARSRENDRTALLYRLGEELADTVIYADLLAAKAHIDLAQWVRMKFNGVSIREGWPERLRERDECCEALRKSCDEGRRDAIAEHPRIGFCPADSELARARADNARLREAATKVVNAIVSSGSGPAAPCFDEHDYALERRRGSWHVVDGQAIDDLRAALSADAEPCDCEPIVHDSGDEHQPDCATQRKES